MSSPDNGNIDGKTPGKFKTEPEPDMPIEGNDEPCDLMINIKEEPQDDGYCQTYSNTNGDTCNGPNDSSESAELDDVESNNSDEVPETNEDVTQQSVVAKTAIAPCVPVTTVPNGGGLRSIIKTTKILPRDLKFTGLQNTKQVVASTRLLPVGLKTSCPIPIALTVNTPEVNPKANRSALSSQTSAHHLMTLATEADKILKRQKKTSEKGSNSDHTDDDKLSNSDEDNMCTSDSSNGIDPFVNCSDQTLTMIQRRAAEASLSASKSKKTKRKRSQLPDDLKDQTYWERRRKNNEAAKRSRDARRAKEDQIAIRAALLEQENMRLKIEVAALKEETIKLRGMLYDKR